MDVVYEDGKVIRSVEIKSGKTFSAEYTSGLETCMRFSDEAPAFCSIVYARDMEMKMKGIEVIKCISVE